MRSQNTPTLCAVSAAPAAKEDWLTATRENWGARTPCRPGHIAGTLPKFGQCLVQLEYDDVAAPEKTPLFAMGLLLDQFAQYGGANSGRSGHHRDLDDRVLRRDVRVIPTSRRRYEVRCRVDTKLVPILDKFFRIVEKDARTRPEVGGARLPGYAIGHERVVPACDVLLRVGVVGPVSSGRPWNQLGLDQFCPMSVEPLGVIEPSALLLNAIWERPVPR